METDQQKVRNIVSEILSFDGNFFELSANLNKLHELYVDITGIRGDRFEDAHKRGTRTEHGKAISPNGAAFCLFEVARTNVFLKGIRNALEDLLERFPFQKIEILYAGCGPYGLLILPLLPFYSPDRISVTLIDIHEESLTAVRSVVKRWGLEPFIREIVMGDATSPRILPAEYRAHMLVTETMLNALRTEPHVAVTLNLVMHLLEGGILIPENITVSAELFNYFILKQWMMSLNPALIDGPVPSNEEESKILLKKLISFDLDMARQWSEEYRKKGSVEFSPVDVTIPEHPPGFDRLNLFTYITVYENYRLKNQDCSLTRPVKVMRLKDFDGNPPKLVRFRYEMGQKPGFVYELF